MIKMSVRANSRDYAFDHVTEWFVDEYDFLTVVSGDDGYEYRFPLASLDFFACHDAVATLH